MTEREIKLAKANNIVDKLYSKEVNRLIRKRYSESEEMAMIRHHALDTEKYSAEWEEYNSYVESCKLQAKATLGIEG